MSPKPDPRPSGRLFVLDLSGGRVLSMKTDGSDETVIAAGCHLPDGIAIDTRAGHVYWTNMGVPSREDGSIERADLDGKNRTIIVPVGGTFTPKQCHLDKANRSEEHTSELQSLTNLVCRLLLEKKKKNHEPRS